MVDKKKLFMSNKKETPFNEKDLKKLPLAYRNLIRRETDTIGELYQEVKFSYSKRHRSIMFNNYSDFKPISNLCYNSDLLNEGDGK